MHHVEDYRPLTWAIVVALPVAVIYRLNHDGIVPNVLENPISILMLTTLVCWVVLAIFAILPISKKGAITEQMDSAQIAEPAVQSGD